MRGWRQQGGWAPVGLRIRQARRECRIRRALLRRQYRGGFERPVGKFPRPRLIASSDSRGLPVTDAYHADRRATSGRPADMLVITWLEGWIT